MNNFINQKHIWSENDYENLNWHDCKIHALAFNNDEFQFYLDIDYIFEWVEPSKEVDYYMFKVAPCILVFRNVYDLNINIQSIDFQIQEVQRENPASPKNLEHIQEKLEYEWIIVTTAGEVTFKSVGFNQYIKSDPILLDKQCMSLTERGGILIDIKTLTGARMR